MKLEEVEEPKVGKEEVLIKVRAAGVNPVDTYIRGGSYGGWAKVPYTPGMDAAGEVEKVGEEVAGIKAGSRVYTTGTMSGAYAEKVLCKADQVYILADNVSFAQGAALGVPYTTAYHGLFGRARAKPGEVVLVHGASGGVGLAAVQIAKACGMMVIGTAGTEAGRELVKREGADYVVDHKHSEHWRGVMQITGGRGVDVVLEMLANVNLGGDLEVLSMGGRVVIIGSRGDVKIDPRQAMMREADVMGMVVMHMTVKERGSAQAAIRAGLAKEVLRPVVREEIPLKEAPRAHELVIEEGSCGKIVLVP